VRSNNALAYTAKPSAGAEAWRGIGRDVSPGTLKQFGTVNNELRNRLGKRSKARAAPCKSEAAIGDLGRERSLMDQARAPGPGVRTRSSQVHIDRPSSASLSAYRRLKRDVAKPCAKVIKGKCKNIKDDYQLLKRNYTTLFSRLQNDYWQTGMELGAAGFSYASAFSEGMQANYLDGASNEFWRASAPGAPTEGNDLSTRLGNKANRATRSATSYGRIKFIANLVGMPPVAGFANLGYSIHWGKNACYTVQKSWHDLKDHYRQGSPLVVSDTINLLSGGYNGIAAGLSAASTFFPPAAIASSGAWVAGAGCGVLAKAAEKYAPQIERQTEKLLAKLD